MLSLKTFEEQAIKLIGPDIYEKLIKGYMKNDGDVQQQPTIYHQAPSSAFDFW